MGGRIRLYSTEGVGTKIEVDMPLTVVVPLVGSRDSPRYSPKISMLDSFVVYISDKDDTGVFRAIGTLGILAGYTPLPNLYTFIFCGRQFDPVILTRLPFCG